MSLVSRNGGAPRDLGIGGGPSWSPDGRWIAFVRRWSDPRRDDAIFVMHPDGSGVQRVFLSGVRSTLDGGFGPVREGFVVGRIVWSPDSRSIAFARAFGRGTSVWTLDLTTGALRQITEPAR
jgi:Tol biopolymer transport system component